MSETVTNAELVEAEVEAHAKQTFERIKGQRRPVRTWRPRRAAKPAKDQPLHMRGCPPERD